MLPPLVLLLFFTLLPFLIFGNGVIHLCLVELFLHSFCLDNLLCLLLGLLVECTHDLRLVHDGCLTLAELLLIETSFSLLYILGHHGVALQDFGLGLHGDDLAVVFQVLLDCLATHLLVLGPFNGLRHWHVLKFNCPLFV